MSNHIKRLAQKVLDGYAKDLSALDDVQIQALVDLGDQAQATTSLRST